jgi:hypothetical protein
MPYEITVSRSDIEERQHWIANSPRILRTMLDTAYRDGWWLVRRTREDAAITFDFVDTRGETLREVVRFLPSWGLAYLHGPERK